MNKLRTLGLGAICTSATWAAACGDDSGTTTNPLPDAATLDATASDASKSDAPVSTEAGVDAQADAAPDAPWCGSERAGGALCAPGQWRAFDPPVDAGPDADAGLPTGTCKQCPTTSLTCQTAVLRVVDGGLTFEPPKFDSSTQKLNVTLPAGQLEGISITGATARVSQNCYGADNGSATGPQSVPGTIHGDTISFDFSGTDAGTSARPCGAISFTLKDACCTTSNVTVNAYWDGEAGRITNGSCPNPDAGDGG